MLGGMRWLPALLILACTGAASARQATLSIARASLPAGELRDVHVTLDDEAKRELRAARLTGLGYDFRDLRWSCSVQPDGEDVACRGPLRARGAARATLAASYRGDVLTLALEGGGGRLALAFGTPLQITGADVPAAWLQALLSPAWPEATLTAGRIDADLRFGSTASGGTSLLGPIAASGLGLDTTDGRIAAAALDARGTVSLDFDAAATGATLDLDLAGGELLAGPFYTSLSDSPVDVALAARGGDGAWEIQRATWRDPGVLQAEASGSWRDGSLSALAADVRAPDLAAVNARYLSTLLATAGLKDLALSGAARLAARRANGAWQDIEVRLDDVGVRDNAGRFALEALSGTLPWSADAAQEGALQWSSAALHAIAIAAGRVALRSEGRGVAIAAPLALDMLGGQVVLPRFAWHPDALDLAVSLRGIDLAAASRALGWPAFSGTLAGELPGVRWQGDVLAFEGALALSVFDGRIEVADLVLERPFGVAPTLAASVAIDELDLKPLTGVFGFGQISGRLDGRIDGLRLVDWQPVAFDARLRTDDDARDARRISQRAVQDLSTVGGAGIAGGLQAQVLKVFDTFPYARIGLSCRLADNVCEMAGLDSSRGGYTIVEGSGLPRITVVGHQRRVDWPVLVARLKAATAGQSPIVD